MLKFIGRRLALSEQGSRDFLRGGLWTAALDLALLLPAVYLLVYLHERIVLSMWPGHGFTFYLLLAMALLTILYQIARRQYRSTYTSVYAESELRRVGIAEKLRLLPLSFFGRRNLSDLTATIMEDCTELEHTFSHAVPQLVASLASLSLIAVGLFLYDWRMALATLWVAPVAMAMILASKRWQRRNNQTIYLKKRKASEAIHERLETVHEIKACGLERRFQDELDELLEDYERTLTHVELATGVIVNAASSVLRLGLASAILIGAYLLSRGALDIFSFLVFLLVASRIYGPIEEVFNNLAALFYLDVRIDRMREIESLPVLSGERDVEVTNFDIEFRDVHFAYEEEIPVLRGVSFTAKQGEVTALVGPSGSGKSTAAKLSARFWEAGSGEILLGGVPVSRFDPEELLRHFSVVFQDVVLFNASVLENVRIGRKGARDEEVRRAARLARCEEFIDRLPQGWDTVIGENGQTLSGGERQRLSIARAILKDAPIVLLDEATASLDVENETRIQASLSELMRGKTVLVIAHRMRTVADADKVVVLEEGRVVECGTPAELEAAGGLFSHMLRRQMPRPLVERT
jgi:ATP-binding cassette subfamily B protein